MSGGTPIKFVSDLACFIYFSGFRSSCSIFLPLLKSCLSNEILSFDKALKSWIGPAICLY